MKQSFALEGLVLLVNSFKVTMRFKACSPDAPPLLTLQTDSSDCRQMGSSSSPCFLKTPPFLMWTPSPPTPPAFLLFFSLHLYPRDAEVMLIKQTAVHSIPAINQVISKVTDLWYITTAVKFKSTRALLVQYVHLILWGGSEWKTCDSHWVSGHHEALQSKVWEKKSIKYSKAS